VERQQRHGSQPLRIFNPATQAAKFDPEASYIRTWLPELVHVSTDDLIRGQIGALKRRDYPEPIMDHKHQQAHFKALYAALPRPQGCRRGGRGLRGVLGRALQLQQR
jgi:deoxyribodipyrimidine photolyase